MKRLILSVITAVMLLNAQPVLAQENCVEVYGQGVVCGAKTPEEHIPVKAGLADLLLNPTFLGGSLLTVSGVLFYISKRNVVVR